MPESKNLIPFRKGYDPRRGSKPKGSRHLSYWIQVMMSDEAFETNIIDGKLGIIEYKGAPIQAIIAVAIQRALHDQKSGIRWAEWLSRNGWRQPIDIVSDNRPIQFVCAVPRPPKQQPPVFY